MLMTLFLQCHLPFRVNQIAITILFHCQHVREHAFSVPRESWANLELNTQDESLGVLLPIHLAIQFLANCVRLILLQKNM